jgi:hypothetical protein
MAERAAGRAANKASKRVSRSISDFGSNIVWSIGFALLFAVVLGCVICGVGGTVVYYFIAPAPGGGSFAGSSADTEWDGSSTFKCKGNDRVTLSDVSATVEGVGIDAGANCTLVLNNVDVDAETALRVRGNATVTMTGGSLSGSKHAVNVSGNGTVVLSGVDTSGEIKKGRSGHRYHHTVAHPRLDRDCTC